MWQHNARNNEEPLAAIMLRSVGGEFSWVAVLLQLCSIESSISVPQPWARTNPLANQPSRDPITSHSFLFIFLIVSPLLLFFFGPSERVAFTVFANEVVLFEAMGFSLAVWPHVADAKWNVLLSVLLHQREQRRWLMNASLKYEINKWCISL